MGPSFRRFLASAVVFAAGLAGLAVRLKPQALPQPAEAIDDVITARARAENFSGTALVAREGRVLYRRAFGLANREWEIPNDIDTKFEIGSMTKQFTALLILQFVNEGKIRLDGHLSDYLPYYRKETGSRVTVRELLAHTSGVPDFISRPGFVESSESRTTYTVRDFASKFCSGDLRFEPGSRFEYSNCGYFLLGAILEEVSRKTYEVILKERILEPLGMHNSGYTHTETILPHRASGYERSSSGFHNARYYDMSIPFAAGAMYSTVGDLFLWDQGLYTDQLLPAHLLNLLFKPNLDGYGFGWGILVPPPGEPYSGESIPMHGGAIFGFESLIERMPAHRELIVLLANSDNAKLLETAMDIRRILANAH